MGRKPNLRVTKSGLFLKRPNKRTGHRGYGRRGIIRTVRRPTSATPAVQAAETAQEQAA